MDKLVAKLASFEESIQSSPFWAETKEVFTSHNVTGITAIRCLALGSPADSNAALYQLAYLRAVAKFFDVQNNGVSLYDPVFNDLDSEVFAKLNYAVEESYVPESASSTLYFLPHADLKLTQAVIISDEIKWLLGNDIVAHTDRFTKKKLYDEYRTLALLLHSIESGSEATETKKADGEEDAFQPVVSRRKGRKGKGKNVFVEPEISYDYSEVYFDGVKATRLKETQGIWGNAFTDLALHSLETKTPKNQ